MDQKSANIELEILEVFLVEYVGMSRQRVNDVKKKCNSVVELLENLNVPNWFDFEISLDEKVKIKLTREGYNPLYGARPLRRLITKYIEDKGVFVPAEAINFSISADHRILDGATVAKFGSRMKQLIENPNLMLLNMH